MSGRTLVIDTATPALTLALWCGDGLLGHVHEVIGRGHAERLVPAIATLPDGGRSDRIVVGVGPGSFTGIRVGVAAARALGLAWRADVRGLPTLALLAAQWDGACVAAIPGGHGEAFVQSFDGARGVPEPARSVPLSDLARDLEGSVVVAPPALSQWIRPARAAEVDARRFPGVAGLATLPPSPVYVRGPDAQRPA